jgi:hypothetical protein
VKTIFGEIIFLPVSLFSAANAFHISLNQPHFTRNAPQITKLLSIPCVAKLISTVGYNWENLCLELHEVRHQQISDHPAHRRGMDPIRSFFRHASRT